MDFSKMMEGLQKMQSQMTDMQSKITDTQAAGEAGGGMVRIVLDGKHHAVDVQISKEAMADPEFLADLVKAAISQASDALAQKLETQVKQMMMQGGGG